MDVDGVCSLQNPSSGGLCFSSTVLSADAAATLTDCLTLILPEDSGRPAGPHIAVARPRAAFATIVDRFFANRPVTGIHPTAQIGSGVVLGKGTSIGAYTVVNNGVAIGSGTVIHNHVTIGPRVRIGSDCIIKSGAVIGEEGFGMDVDEAGNNIRIPHLGSVVVGDHVEIGALNTVCAGTIEPTILEDYVKMDDHVHVAHNVRIGRNCVVTACSEISGSVSIGEDTWLGPNCSIMNGITIGSHVLVGLGAVVTKSLDAGQIVKGNPARPRQSEGT